MNRCPWAIQDELSKEYHDIYWGKPIYDSKLLFKMLMLEIQQAGLSWSLILKKLNTLEVAYSDFDPSKLITYSESDVDSLLINDGIIKHRLKIEAMIHNAMIFFKIESKYGSFSDFIWSFVDSKPIINHYHFVSEIPSKTILSDLISKALKKEGIKFIGSTTTYSFMQAVGIVNDHLDTCDFK